jgi:hypothetical protein
MFRLAFNARVTPAVKQWIDEFQTKGDYVWSIKGVREKICQEQIHSLD